MGDFLNETALGQWELGDLIHIPGFHDVARQRLYMAEGYNGVVRYADVGVEKEYLCPYQEESGYQNGRWQLPLTQPHSYDAIPIQPGPYFIRIAPDGSAADPNAIAPCP